MIDFWFEFASTYSYPAAMRIERLADAAGVAVRWRPFLLGPIFGAQGWNDSPFNIYPVKGAYMWRDLERICAKENLPLKLPPFRFPQNGLKAARLALAGEKDGWTAAFTRAVFTANFGEERDIADDDLLRSLVKRVGGDPQQAWTDANSPEIKAALKTQTDDAIARGVFGAPSFTVGKELFWGNDRLEGAIAWAAKGQIAQPDFL
ncbi:MAG TPA: 2-hydroxychromene-2-carboxylate isomerase [Rhizomicrobium sp.]|nr:2-hydroxychromene-2-carboxylate isomerase [Rhizomicrobium sp.]